MQLTGFQKLFDIYGWFMVEHQWLPDLEQVLE